MIRLFPVLAIVGLLAACGFDDTPAPAAPPTIVNVTTPPTDGGLSVLLTIALIAALFSAVAAVVLGALWLHERSRRAAAEDLVVELSGLPVARVARVRAAGGDLSAWRPAAPALTEGGGQGRDLPAVRAVRDPRP